MFEKNKPFQLSPRLKYGVGRGDSRSNIMKIGSALFLIVAAGLMYNAVNLVLNGDDTTEQAAAPVQPSVLGATDTPEQPTADSEYIRHEVKEGDTLFNIGQQYGVSWTTLVTLNNLKSPFTLDKGQIVIVPKQ